MINKLIDKFILDNSGATFSSNEQWEEWTRERLEQLLREGNKKLLAIIEEYEGRALEDREINN